MDPTTNFIARATRLAPLLALLLVLAAPPVHADEHDNERPSASFTNSPSTPVVGEQVTFTSTSTDPDGQITGQWWDLDNDGSYDDGTAKTVTKVFASAGNKTVRLRVEDNDDATRSVSRTVTVAANAAPTADFSASTTTPDTGQAVTLTSTSTDPDGRPLTQEWDLDDDGAYDDANGGTASVTFTTSGTRRVGLRVTDSGGTVRMTSREIAVRDRPPPGPAPSGGSSPPASFPAPVVNGPAPPKPTLIGPRLLDPFPLVRIRGVTTPRGARVDLLSVRTLGGTKILVRCRGRGCPWARKTAHARFSARRLRAVNMPGFKRRHLRAGTVLEVFVTQKGMIGKYTRFKIRRLKAPLRTDSCTAPGRTRVRRCPA